MARQIDLFPVAYRSDSLPNNGELESGLKMAGNPSTGLNRDEHGFDAPVALGHPIRSGLPDGHPAGPAVGETLPDFALPDAQGRMVRFHEDRGGARSAVVFYRSAVW